MALEGRGLAEWSGDSVGFVFKPVILPQKSSRDSLFTMNGRGARQRTTQIQYQSLTDSLHPRIVEREAEKASRSVLFTSCIL